MHNGYASSAGNSDTVDGYHASGLLTALSNSNNGISITVGGTTKSISNISVNHASNADTATTSSMLKTSNWNGGSYVPSDTHYMCLGYMNCTGSYDCLTLLVTSAFWGNQHGSQDIITIQQSTNTNDTARIQTNVGRLRLGGSHNRSFYYYKDDSRFRLYLYVYVIGGNSYGRWNISYLGGNATWVTDHQENVTKSSSWIGIGYSAQVNYASSSGSASKVYGQVGATGSHELVRCDMHSDQFRIIAGSSGNNKGWAEIATADDGNEPIYVRQYSGVFSSVVRTLTLLDANGHTHFPSYINIGGNENNNSSPDRVWGSNGSDSYLRSYRTSALNVNYAASAGNADTVDDYHATDGRTFTGNINWSPNWNDAWSDGTNKHPWYGFDHRYANTGAYSTTITDYYGMTIKTANTLRLDFRTLLLNGTNIYDIKVADSDKLDGYHESLFLRYRGSYGDASVTKDGVGVYGWSHTNTGHNNFHESYGDIINIQGFSTWRTRFDIGTSGRIRIMHGINTTTATEVGYLAYLHDNVASATKLQTPRTIWGQSFDGTNNIGGTILPSATHTYNLGSTTYVFEKTYTRYVDTDNKYDLRLSCTGIEVLRLAAADKSANINYNANISGNLSVNGLISNKGILPTNYEVNDKGPACYVSADALCSGITAITDSIQVNQVTVQYSNDNGNSWTNYSMSNDAKFNLYANNAGLNQVYLGYNVITGNNDAEKLAQVKKNELIVSFYISNNCYAQPYFASVDMSNGIYTICTVEILNNSGTVIETYTKRMTGWNQLNYINLSNGNTAQGVGNDSRRYIRFRFKHDQNTTALRNTVINKIRIFSFTKHSFPTDRFMGHTGHIYNFDYNMNTYFPNSILAKGGVTAYQSSDVRLKTNINKLNCLNVIKSIGGTYEFDYIRDHKHSIGFIAQNVNNPLLKDIVAKDDNGYLKINYWNPKLISLAFGALTEIDDEVDKLKARVRELESEVEYLKNKDYALQ